ncbi:neuronal acetylcholine receptor subunit alpha-7 [Plakobranchus ocellatus]|uniref:Neuronal acetylcholine receptor subunit alpha-7 n=1 Tax=Plakobranchus ocellatus TaxID=259542 RepID=A0AAV4CCN0_9GAST|nr:neuronal acetylcholine receptor subunit alpha-7 [Plakobranchus ocellatus]
MRMMMFVLMLSLGPWERTGVSLVGAATQAQLYQLMDDLFNDYKPEVRPTTAGEATNVYIAMYLLSIQDLDEKSQILETSVILEAFWVDDYLSWTPSAYGNTTYFNYQQLKVWLPDIIVENSVESQRQLGYDENLITISNDGTVHWKPSQIIKTSCDIDVTYYPFDYQTCNIIVSTWMSSKTDIDIETHSNSRNGINLDRYSTSGTWELVSDDLSELPNENDLTRIQFKIKLKRLRSYYVLNIILPVLFLSFTASMVFFLPADAGEKIGMGITVLLAYAVYLTIIADNMPQTSLQVSYLAVYLTLLLGLTAMGVVLAVVVLHIHHKPDERKVGKRTETIVRKLRFILGLYRQDSTNGLQNIRVSPSENKGLSGAGTSHHQLKEAFSPPPSYCERKEEITWPKVAETLDRVMFIFTSCLITLITIIFFPLLSFGSG